ncbi:MAG: TetR/AcrR family transcriptional regulator [bacterium]|nr:TetR/AcrR family transcriptional regulator [bacterium]
MGKLDTNKKIKHDSLLNTAFDLFITKGINKTSISEIVDSAGVGKGTFYLYFKDKYDLRNKLVSHKSSELFHAANEALIASGITDFEESIIFIVNHIVDDLDKDQSLLTFISKNLSWGIFKNALITPSENDVDFYNVYIQMLKASPHTFKNPEILIFMIVELVSSTVYSAILYKEPVSLEELKPYLYETIRQMIRQQMTND